MLMKQNSYITKFVFVCASFACCALGSSPLFGRILHDHSPSYTELGDSLLLKFTTSNDIIDIEGLPPGIQAISTSRGNKKRWVITGQTTEGGSYKVLGVTATTKIPESLFPVMRARQATAESDATAIIIVESDVTPKAVAASQATAVSTPIAARINPNLHIIKWKPAKRGPFATSFTIFKDKALTKPVVIIENNGENSFQFKHALVKSIRTTKYYIVATGVDGSYSKPRIARVKERLE